LALESRGALRSGVLAIQFQADWCFLAGDFVEVRHTVIAGGTKPTGASVRRWTLQVVAKELARNLGAAVAKT
jgi:hypothetical protein